MFYRFGCWKPCLIPLGPKRAPGRNEVPVSKGAPESDVSWYVVEGGGISYPKMQYHIYICR